MKLILIFLTTFTFQASYKNIEIIPGHKILVSIPISRIKFLRDSINEIRNNHKIRRIFITSILEELLPTDLKKIIIDYANENKLNISLVNAIIEGNLENTANCIDRGANLNCSDFVRLSNMFLEDEISNYLIYRGTSYCLLDKYKRNLLHNLCTFDENESLLRLKRERWQFFEKLTTEPTLLTGQDIDGQTPLHLALLTQQHLDFIYQLVNSGAETEIKNNANETAIDVAKKIKAYDNDDILRGWVLKAVKKANFDRAVETNKVLQPILNYEIIQLINRYMSSQTSRGSVIDYELLIAAKEGNLKNVKLAISHGANINYLEFGDSPLGEAITYGKSEIIEFLILRPDLDLEIIDEESCTLLHKAIASMNVKLVEFLLNCGTDFKKKFRFVNPLQYAKRIETTKYEEQRSIIELLEKYEMYNKSC